MLEKILVRHRHFTISHQRRHSGIKTVGQGITDESGIAYFPAVFLLPGLDLTPT
jgi:hypothetical protein